MRGDESKPGIRVGERCGALVANVLCGVSVAFVLVVSAVASGEETATNAIDVRATAPRVELPALESVAGLEIPTALRDERIDVVMTIGADGTTHLAPRIAVRREPDPARRDPRPRRTPPLVIVIRADAATRFGAVAEGVEGLDAVGAQAVDWMVRDASGREARLTMPETRGPGRIRRGARVPEVEVSLRPDSKDGREKVLIVLRSGQGERVESVEPAAVSERLLVLLGSEQIRNPGFSLKIAPSSEVRFDAVARALDVARRLELSDRRLVLPPVFTLPVVPHPIDRARVADPRVVVTLDASGDPWVDGVACDDVATVLAVVRRVAEARRGGDAEAPFAIVLETDALLPFEAIAPMLIVAAGPGFGLDDVRFAARTTDGTTGTVPVRVRSDVEAPRLSTVRLTTDGGRTSIERTEPAEGSARGVAIVPQRRTTVGVCVEIAARERASGHEPVVLLPMPSASEDDE